MALSRRRTCDEISVDGGDFGDQYYAGEKWGDGVVLGPQFVNATANGCASNASNE
ncbi:hypothetical protein OAF83_01500 [Rubripirellula sp.]|nr:hypothetical protein [Rubripirellula sp.]